MRFPLVLPSLATSRMDDVLGQLAHRFCTEAPETAITFRPFHYSAWRRFIGFLKGEQVKAFLFFKDMNITYYLCWNGELAYTSYATRWKRELFWIHEGHMDDWEADRFRDQARKLLKQKVLVNT